MIWSQQMRKVMRMRRYWIMFIIVFGVVMGVFGTQILGGIARTCPEPPQLAAGVGDDIRTKMELLDDLGLLYCAQPSSDQALVNERIYWGSDGVTSALYFAVESPDEVSIESMTFGDGYVPGAAGGARPIGFTALEADGPAFENQAPPGASYFYREDGAPSDADFAVNIYITGPAALNEQATGRDFWRDLNLVLSNIRGETAASGAPSVTTRFPIPLLPDRWLAVRETWVNPELADEEGRASVAALAAAQLVEPTLYKTVTGPLASSVWVAGVVTGTTPMLTLAPVTAMSDETVVPYATGLWRSNQPDIETLLAHFAFPPQPAGSDFQARFWDEAASFDEAAPPDRTWELAFPTPAPDNE